MNVKPNLLSKAQVVEIIRVSDRTIEKLVKNGRFPPALRLGKAVFWEEPVVLGWLDAKLQAQRAWKPKQRRGAAAGAGAPA